MTSTATQGIVVAGEENTVRPLLDLRTGELGELGDVHLFASSHDSQLDGTVRLIDLKYHVA